MYSTEADWPKCHANEGVTIGVSLSLQSSLHIVQKGISFTVRMRDAETKDQSTPHAEMPLWTFSLIKCRKKLSNDVNSGIKSGLKLAVGLVRFFFQFSSGSQNGNVDMKRPGTTVSTTHRLM